MNSSFHMLTRIISFDEENNETVKGWVIYKMRIVSRWFLLMVFIYCTCKFFVSGEDYKYEHPFEVDEDLTRVEDFIINYSKHMKNRFRAGEICTYIFNS